MGWTVAMLREALAAFPDGAAVILAKDGEGNAYRYLSAITAEAFETEAQEPVLYSNDDDTTGLPRAAVLWPNF